MTRFKAFSLLILCALGASHRAQASDLRRLFAKAAEVNVVTRAPGALVRLTLPTEVLSACRADLSDLRLISADGVETPFVVDHGAAPAKPTTKLREVRAQVLGAEHHQTPRAGAEPLLEESYLLGAPPAASQIATASPLCRSPAAPDQSIAAKWRKRPFTSSCGVAPVSSPPPDRAPAR